VRKAAPTANIPCSKPVRDHPEPPEYYIPVVSPERKRQSHCSSRHLHAGKRCSCQRDSFQFELEKSSGFGSNVLNLVAGTRRVCLSLSEIPFYGVPRAICKMDDCQSDE